jgi:thymidylate synthase (FAD)
LKNIFYFCTLHLEHKRGKKEKEEKMHAVEPKVFLIGESRIIEDGLKSYLGHIGASDWESDAPTDAEKLVEIFGRLCYRSFKLGLNPNLTKIRKSNREYIENLKKAYHGSVLEHVVFNFIFADVSRVFTHELVRHRAGVAISQESLRFVRLDDLGQWLPTIVKEDERVMEIFVKTFEQLEDLQRQLALIYGLDENDDQTKKSFDFKKEATSALRRIAPMGLATTIGWSANARALRWILELRTNPSAEEEIRLVFGKVGEIVCSRYPNLFGDFEVIMADGLPYYKPTYSKV